MVGIGGDFERGLLNSIENGSDLFSDDCRNCFTFPLQESRDPDFVPHQELASSIHISTYNSGLVFYYCQRESVGVCVDVLVGEMDFDMSRNVPQAYTSGCAALGNAGINEVV